MCVCVCALELLLCLFGLIDFVCLFYVYKIECNLCVITTMIICEPLDYINKNHYLQHMHEHLEFVAFSFQVGRSLLPFDSRCSWCV